MAKPRKQNSTSRQSIKADGGMAGLDAALRRRSASLSPAEESIVMFMRQNLATIPFETGASMAQKAGVSEMTVLRFIRSLGFANLKALKDQLRARPPGENPAVDDALDRFRVRHDDLNHLHASLQLELSAVVKAYELVATDRWPRIVELLANRQTVYVTGFQASKGLAMDFANRLKYARPGVRFAEGTAGTFSEVLEAESSGSCLILVDTIAYARKSLLLARKCKERKIALVVVTDMFSHWAYEFTELVLEGHTHVNTFWDSSASLSIILNLLINSTAARLGKQAEAQFERMLDYGDHFQEFEKVRETLRRGTRLRLGR
ncbi:MAG TPA: MurR/RpiR family transcriptional regulator [Dongiaceae bacterium]|nr:MurR/RpiR family transcriptional regulator [Dongiaceae bacterium]